MVSIEEMRGIHKELGTELFGIARDFLCCDEQRLPYKGFQSKMFLHHAIYSCNTEPLANIDNNNVGWRDLGRTYTESCFFIHV